MQALCGQQVLKSLTTTFQAMAVVSILPVDPTMISACQQQVMFVRKVKIESRGVERSNSIELNHMSSAEQRRKGSNDIHGIGASRNLC